MKRKARRDHKKNSVLKIVSGALLGSLLGATVGWLTAPVSGAELRRRIRGEVKGVRAKANTAMGTVESRARELAAEMNESAGEGKETSARRTKATAPSRS
ncbi:MAG: YtxH domain-containing protein [Anaerolineales bacterium]